VSSVHVKLIPLTNVNSVLEPYTSFVLGLLAGFFSPNALARLSLLASTLFGGATEEANGFGVSGQIKDGQGNSLAGVEVIASPGGAKATSAADGRYKLSGLAAGQYSLRATLQGYGFADNPRTVDVRAEQGGVDFSAFPVSSIGGNVRDAASQPLPGVQLSALASGPISMQALATTDANGNYVLENLPAGPVTITPVAAGHSFNPQRVSVTLTQDITGQDFTAT
jgi:inhibitor of cysteine peptidase